MLRLSLRKDLRNLKILKLINFQYKRANVSSDVSKFSVKKSKSDIDIELQDNMEDNEYLNVLSNNLKKLNQNNYDFVFYIAGVDIHHEDRLGKLKITDEGINKRDQIVIDNFFSKKIPLCGVLGGGYNKSFDKLIELHSMLHKNCAAYF